MSRISNLQKLRRITNGKHRKPSPSVHLGAVRQSSGTIPRAATIIPINSLISFTIHSYEPHDTIHDSGIRAGEIIAKRCWWVLGDKLFSVYMTETEWLPNIPVTGDVSEGFGVHAFKDTEYVMDYAREALLSATIFDHPSLDFDQPMGKKNGHASYLISGTVALWGQIVEHEHGYRAQYAKILSLDNPSDDVPVDRKLRMKYGV